MNRRVLALLAFFPIVAFAGDRQILTFNGNVPASFAQCVAKSGGALVSQHASAGIAVAGGISEAQAVKCGAAEATADVVVQLQPSDISVDTASPTTASRYSWQWHLRAIGADQAWAAGRFGSPDVTVAVIDTGVNWEHPDLLGRVDLTRSVSFVPSDDADVAVLFPGKHPVTDLYYHGTHVAATITSNAVMAAGVTANVTIIGVKVLSRWGEGTISGVLDGLMWAADHGADVANLSLGDSFLKSGNGRELAPIQKAFNYAHRKGTLVVVSAGNDALDLDHDGNRFNAFCNAANVVCVSATGPTSAASITGPWTDVDAPAWYTNYGRSSISVAAPGGSLAGRVWAACSKTSLLVNSCRTNDLVLGLLGTSMAAPHVAGLAALIVEDVGHGKPSLVKARLQQSADDLGLPGTDPFYGKGRINVPRAIGLE